MVPVGLSEAFAEAALHPLFHLPISVSSTTGVYPKTNPDIINYHTPLSVPETASWEANVKLLVQNHRRPF